MSKVLPETIAGSQFLMQKDINKNIPSLYSYPGLSLVTLCWIQNLGTEDVQCLKAFYMH